MQHALEQLKELLGESSPFQGRLPNSISFKDLQQKLEEVQTVAQLCEEVLGIEGAVSLLGSGPRGDHYPQRYFSSVLTKHFQTFNFVRVSLGLIDRLWG